MMMKNIVLTDVVGDEDPSTIQQLILELEAMLC